MNSDQGNGDGDGDAYLQRALKYLLNPPPLSSSSAPGSNNNGENNLTHVAPHANERLLSAVLLSTRLESSDERRTLLLGLKNDNESGRSVSDAGSEVSGGGGLGWFALALIKRCITESKSESESGNKTQPQSQAQVNAALLHLSVRSLSLLYSEMPIDHEGVHVLDFGRPTFHKRCGELLIDVLQCRTERRVGIEEADVEIAATLSCMTRRSLVGNDLDGWPDAVLRRCVDVLQASTGEKDVAASAAMDIDGVQEESRSRDNQAEDMMVQIINSTLSPQAEEDMDDADTSSIRQYLQVAASYIENLLDTTHYQGDDNARPVAFVSRQLLLDSIKVATMSGRNDDGKLFVPIALKCITHAIQWNVEGIKVSRGFDLVAALDAEASASPNFDVEVAQAAMKLFLTAISVPDNDLSARELIFNALAALSDSAGLKWMTRANINTGVGNGTDQSKSDLGPAAGCCALVRLAAGELRISLGWILGYGDDDASDDEDNLFSLATTSSHHMGIVNSCISICLAALKLMVDLSTALDDEEDAAMLPAEVGPFAILNMRHSLLDAVDSTIQFLNEKPYQVEKLRGPFRSDVMGNIKKSTKHCLTIISTHCSRLLFAYVSETDIFEDEKSGMSDNIPSAKSILGAMKSGLAVCHQKAEGDIKTCSANNRDDYVVPLLPGLAALLATYIDGEESGQKTTLIKETLFTDDIVSASIYGMIQRLFMDIEHATDDKRDNNGENIAKLPTYLASLDLCCLIVAGIVAFQSVASPFSAEETARQQTQSLRVLSESMYNLIEVLEEIGVGDARRDMLFFSLHRLVDTWHHVVPEGCVDISGKGLGTNNKDSRDIIRKGVGYAAEAARLLSLNSTS